MMTLNLETLETRHFKIPEMYESSSVHRAVRVMLKTIQYIPYRGSMSTLPGIYSIDISIYPRPATAILLSRSCFES